MVVVLVQVRLHTAAALGLGPPAAALWQRLRLGFPWTVAAMLRVRSVVWLGRVPSIEHARRGMERVMSPLRRQLGWPQLEIDASEVVATKVGLVARRVLGLADGEVPASEVALPGWSTARDLLGGVADPWVHPRVFRELTWGAGGCWDPVTVSTGPTSGLDVGPWLEPVRAALRAPWLHATAPTVSGLLRGVRARVRGEGMSPVPEAWVDAALRCALDPRLRGFPQPPAPPGRVRGESIAVRWPMRAAEGRR